MVTFIRNAKPELQKSLDEAIESSKRTKSIEQEVMSVRVSLGLPNIHSTDELNAGKLAADAIGDAIAILKKKFPNPAEIKVVERRQNLAKVEINGLRGTILGEYPGLDERPSSCLRWLRQAGAALCCLISFFTADQVATAHTKGAPNYESIFCPLLPTESVAISDFTKNPDSHDPSAEIDLVLRGQWPSSARDRECFVPRTQIHSCSNEGQIIFVGNRQRQRLWRRIWTKSNPIYDRQLVCWCLPRIFDFNKSFNDITIRYAVDDFSARNEYIGAQLSARGGYLPKTYPNQTASNDHEKNGRYRGYGPVVMLQEGTEANNEILQRRYFLSGIIFIVGTLIALLVAAYFWRRSCH